MKPENLMRSNSTEPRASDAWLLPLMLLVFPFLVYWRMWSSNPFDLGLFYQDNSLVEYVFEVAIADSIGQFGEWPKWAWGTYLGVPFDPVMFNYILYPFSLPWTLGWVDTADPAIFHLQFLFSQSIAGLSLYILARSFNYSRFISFSGALVYTFAGTALYRIIGGQMFSIPHAWLPLSFLCARQWILKRNPAWTLGLAVTLFMALVSNNPFILCGFFLLGAFIVYTLYVESTQGHRRWLLGGIVFSFGLAFLLAAPRLLPILQMGQTLTRNAHSSIAYCRDNYVLANSFVFIRDFFLGAHYGTYCYLGALGGMFALLGFWSERGRYYRFWAVSFVLSALVALLTNDYLAYEMFYLFFPKGSNLCGTYRMVGFFYMLPATFMLMGGMHYGSRVLETLPKAKTLMVPLWVCFFGLSGVLYFSFNYVEGIKELFYPWFLTVGAGLFLISMIKRRRVGSLAMAGIAFLFIMDVISIPIRTTNYITTREVLNDPNNLLNRFKSPYVHGRSQTAKLPSLHKPRVDSFRNQVSLITGPDNIGGYYPMVPKRTAQLMKAARIYDTYLFSGPLGLDETRTLTGAQFQKLFHREPEGLSRAWLVSEALDLENPYETITTADFEVYQQATLEEESKVLLMEFGRFHAWLHKTMEAIFTSQTRPIPDSNAEPFSINPDLSLVRQTFNTATFQLQRATSNEFLVFSDSWYPGWTVYVNGERVPLFVADYAFKGIHLSADPGTMIEFVFDPPILKLGWLMSILGFVIILLVGGFCVIRKTPIGPQLDSKTRPSN